MSVELNPHNYTNMNFISFQFVAADFFKKESRGPRGFLPRPLLRAGESVAPPPYPGNWLRSFAWSDTIGERSRFIILNHFAMNKTLLWVIIIVAVIVGLWFVFWNKGTKPEPVIPELEVEQPQVGREIIVQLSEQNNSGVSGFAYIQEVEDDLVVALALSGAPENVAQPAHIHRNNCEDIGGVLHPLEFPVNNYSSTNLSLTMDELLSQAPISINVHKSADEAQVYVACGNIEVE
ncbi:MAG: putative exported protein [Parcubacteria group bacterium Gr01-1014_30]|nr:MAG: putative exported protein [Parcubacteria group bacterium Gr01-1014_30]